MSVLGIMSGVYLVYFIHFIHGMLSKPDTEEEKKERLKRQSDFAFATGFFLITAVFFNPITRHYFLEELGWPTAALCALNVFVLAIFIVALVLWERNRNNK